MPYRSLALIVTLATALGAANDAEAQEARLNFVQARTDHWLLGTLRGVSIELGLPVLSRVGVRLGYEFQRRSYNDLASTCSGLIPPGDACGPEPTAEEAAMDDVTLAVSLTLVTLQRVQLEVAPALRLASVDHTRRGLVTGGRLRGDKSMWAPEIGAAAAVAPVTSWPVRIRVGWRRSVLRPVDEEVVLDGYTPFERKIGTTRWEIGVVVGMKGVP